MSVPPDNPQLFNCYRGTTASFSFDYLNNDGSVIDISGYDLVAEFAAKAGGEVVFTATPTWHQDTGQIDFVVSPQDTQQIPKKYTSDIRLVNKADPTDDVVLIQYTINIVPTFP
jgi:hypothetical protein